MAGHRRFSEPPGTGLDDRARQRQAQLDKKAALTTRMADMAARRAAAMSIAPILQQTPERPARDVQGYMDALAALPFHKLGNPEIAELTPAYARLVRSAAEVVSDGLPQVVMAWPAGQVSPTAIVSLLSLAAVANARCVEAVITGERTQSRDPADEVRAVIFPYARSTHAQARAVQVDRHGLGAIHFDHLKRCVDGNPDPAVKDFHQVLARVRSLSGRASDGRNYAEFEHPILDELVPHGPPRGDRASNSELLWRTRGKTDIGKQARSGAADDPSKAAHYIYTIRADQRLGVELRAIARSPDLLVLDLTRAARGRLGWDWMKGAAEMIACMREIHPTAGILAITDDPWTFRAARFDLLGSKPPGRRAAITPAKGHVVFCRNPGVVQEAGLGEPSFEGCSRVSIDGFFGEVDRSIEQLRFLANRLIDQGDSASADLVRNVIATVRRSACLPGSLRALSQFLERETTVAIADDQLAMYRIAADLTALTDPRSLASQVDAEEKATEAAAAVMRSLEAATPMTTMLEAALQPALRASSKSLFVFRFDMVAEFAADQLTAANPKLVDRLKRGLIIFGGSRVLGTVATGSASARNQFKRMVVVAPTRPSILTLLAEEWLPEHLTILADADTLAFAARDADRLAKELDSEPIVARLRAFADRATERVAEIGRHAVQLESQMPPDDVEFPSGSVVDLSGGGRGERRLVTISMNNGQRIIARPSTGIVIRNDTAATTSFIERPASQVRTGDEVCVIGPAFVERARTLVNIRATAAAEIREYHQQVVDRFSEIPGSSVAERLREVVSRMGEPRVTPERARYWVDIDDEVEKSLHEVVPHAPLEPETFLRFTAALGIGQKLAENFWRWAVVAQRLHRMKSGNVFHDAFRGILTDTHAALASNTGRSADIRALLAMADEHVATVAVVGSAETR